MKRFPLAFIAVLCFTSGGLFAVDEIPPIVGRVVAAVKVWLIDGELAEDGDPIIAVVQSGITGTHSIEGIKPRGGGTREYWTVNITKQDQPNPLPPSPVPPGPPLPGLQGFALEVYQQARNLPANDCKRLAANYETVATMIAAGGIRDTLTANAKLTELNKSLSLSPSTWSSFAQWLGGKFNTDAQTLEASRKLMLETATGLNAVGAR